MITFRPHTLTLKKQGGGYYDTSGDWNEGSMETSEHVACRYEPNGGAQTITLPDGSDYAYHYTIYLDPGVGIAPVYGDAVELFDNSGASIGEYTVRGVHRYQLGTRIWV